MSMMVNSFAFGAAAAGYVETGILGHNTTDGTSYGPASNEKGVQSITVPSGGVWVKKAYIKVLSATAGNKFKPVLYTGTISTSTLVKVGQELVLPAVSSSTDFSVNWNSDGSSYFIPAGTYGFGYHTLGADNVAANFVTNIFWNADTYSDGPSSPFGATSSSTRTPCIWMPYSVTGP